THKISPHLMRRVTGPRASAGSQGTNPMRRNRAREKKSVAGKSERKKKREGRRGSMVLARKRTGVETDSVGRSMYLPKMRSFDSVWVVQTTRKPRSKNPRL